VFYFWLFDGNPFCDLASRCDDRGTPSLLSRLWNHRGSDL